VDALTGRLSTRFLAVTVLPTSLLVAYLLFLVAAGAPMRTPRVSEAVDALDQLSGRQLAVVVLLLLGTSIATHPLQVPLIQLLEGYWWRLPFGFLAADLATTRFREELRQIRRTLVDVQRDDWFRSHTVDDASYRQHWMPAEEEELLPTRLGNVLRAGETRAGARYGLNLVETLPRLFPRMSPEVLAEIDDRRNQLDAGVRLCVVSAAATAAGLLLLLPTGSWMFLPIVTFILCWASYHGAVASAQGYSTTLAAAVDLYHLDLFDALHLPRPSTLREELDRAPAVQRLFRGESLSRQEEEEHAYVAPTPEGTSKSPQRGDHGV